MKPSKPPIFYVYIMYRLTGEPCYVGKGKGNRWKDHFRKGYLNNHSNKYLARIIKKSGGSLPVTIVRSGMSEKEAHLAEVAYIASIGRKVHGGSLVNQTDGGEGVSGAICSDETKKKISRGNSKPWSEAKRASYKPIPPWNKGVPCTEEAKAHLSKMMTGKPGYSPSKEEREKSSQMRRGIVPAAAVAAILAREVSPLKGRPPTAEHRANVSAARKDKPHPHKGVPRSEECKAKISFTKRNRAAALEQSATT